MFTTDWVREGSRFYKDLIFTEPKDEREVYDFGESHNFWGYHPSGYGLELRSVDPDRKMWRWYRFDTCD